MKCQDCGKPVPPVVVTFPATGPVVQCPGCAAKSDRAEMDRMDRRENLRTALGL